MSYFFVAQIRIYDNIEYQKYIDNAGNIFKKYKGEYLSVDNTPLLLEGKWDYTRMVLIKFDTMDDFNEWYNSEDYQKILKYRLSAADCDTVLIKGIE
ncbi:MAG: DUF1330 domain-containing protein [Bacteroidales bacterium]|jgi:uncharacterized protein (DUF1330 family)